MVPSNAGMFGQRRSATRLAAVQALYALEVSGDAIDAVLGDVVQRRWLPGEPPRRPMLDDAFLRTLVAGVVERREAIDAAVDGALAEGWTTGRLEILLLAILRSGTFELMAQLQTPMKVIINEYVEIAHAFFAGREPSLVNAVLDRLAGRLRAEPDHSADSPDAPAEGAITPADGDGDSGGN